MSDIKNNLSDLCDLLKLIHDFDIEPEFFRYAKHDKNDKNCVGKFWNLLNLFCDINFGDIYDNVKLYLASQNYRNLEFYSLEKKSELGSRELLIAFACLLSDNVLEDRIRTLILNSKISQEFDTPELLLESKNQIQYDFKTVLEYHNRILSFCGKLNLNSKTIQDYNWKTTQLLDKIYSCVPNISVLELNYLKEHKNLDKYVQQIKNISKILDSYAKWKSSEKHFWQWMVSVIEIKNNTNIEPMVDRNTLKKFCSHICFFLENKNMEKYNKIFKVLDESFRRHNFNVERDKTATDLIQDVENHSDLFHTEQYDNIQQILNFIKTTF